MTAAANTTHIDADALDAEASYIEKYATYADGRAHDQDMARAAELRAEAATLRRNALPLEVRCKPVRMVPHVTQTDWSLAYDAAIKRAERDGDTKRAAATRAQRDNYKRCNPDQFAPVVKWRAEA